MYGKCTLFYESLGILRACTNGVYQASPHSVRGNVIGEFSWNESTEVMPASLNCQYSNSRNVEFLYSSDVANPCSVAMTTTTMPLLIALFGSLVMMTWNVSWSPYQYQWLMRSYHCHGNRKIEYLVLCLYLTTSEFQTECFASRKCEHWHENHWLRPLWTRETYSDADDQWCYVTYIIESSLNTHTLLQPVMIYPLLVVTMLSYL